MPHRIEFAPAVDHDFGRLPPAVLPRVDAAIRALAATPRPRGAKKLTEAAGWWRVRVGDYRVIYRIDDAAQVVTIARVRHRRDAYR